MSEVLFRSAEAVLHHKKLVWNLDSNGTKQKFKTAVARHLRPNSGVPQDSYREAALENRDHKIEIFYVHKTLVLQHRDLGFNWPPLVNISCCSVAPLTTSA